MDTPSSPAQVLIPVKAFTRAKLRLATALDPEVRAALARTMADHVVAAAVPLPVLVVCEDHDVAEWAVAAGAQVEWTPGLGLNGAVQEAVRRTAARGTRRVIVAHSDLPFARGLAGLADADHDEVILVADRRGRGTNVMSLPADSRFEFAYGVDSFPRHLAEVERLGLRARVLESEHLGWDVDEPDDLQIPTHLGESSPLVVDGVLQGRTA